MTPESTELAKRIADICPTVIVSFSRGKDSIAAWLHVREHFETVHAFHLHLVPGLEFEEESLLYFERYFGVRIHRLPHPSLFRLVQNFVFQPPERCLGIERLNLRRWKYQELEDMVREREGCPEAYVAIGARTADSPIRLANIKRFGPINRKRKSFQAVHDWKSAHVERAIATAGLELPVDYALWGRSFDGIDYRFLAGLRDRRPNDYRKILEWFPLAELELWRYEHAR